MNYERKKDKINTACRMKYQLDKEKLNYNRKKDDINAARRMKYKADKAKKMSNGQPKVEKLGETQENIIKFHNSLEMTIVQCNVCFEAWPLSNSTKSLKSEEYTCRRC